MVGKQHLFCILLLKNKKIFHLNELEFLLIRKKENNSSFYIDSFFYGYIFILSSMRKMLTFQLIFKNYQKNLFF